MKHFYLLPLALVLLLAACGGEEAVKPDTPAIEPGSPADSADKSEPTPGATKPGAYYLDDGPGDNPPADIDAIPDAVPRPEVPLARANRPYTALGQSYTPMTEYKPYMERGIASWYGKRYQGQKTSSGEVYDMYAMTGAHPTLPIPSYARVTNLGNGRSVVVRINDRGPFHSDRLIDLSYAASYKLRLSEQGSGEVEVEALKPRSALNLKIPDPAARPETIWPSVAESPPKPLPTVQSKAQAVSQAAPKAVGGKAAPASGIYVQAGVFKKKENADRLREQLLQQNLDKNVSAENVSAGNAAAKNTPPKDIPIVNWYNAGTYRVWLGPYASHQDAVRAIAQIKQALGIPTFIVNQ